LDRRNFFILRVRKGLLEGVISSLYKEYNMAKKVENYVAEIVIITLVIVVTIIAN